MKTIAEEGKQLANYWAPNTLRFVELGLQRFSPYHNNDHIYTVVYHSVAAATADGIAHEEMRLLVVAALFHDYAHSGGATDDAANIQRALAGLVVARTKQAFTVTESGMQQIVDAIHSTYFDGTKFPNPPHALGKYLRDADLCMVYDPDGRVTLLKLMQEFAPAISVLRDLNKEKVYTPEEPEYVWWWVQRNAAFLNRAEMFSDYGKALKEFQLERALATLSELAMEDAPPEARELFLNDLR